MARGENVRRTTVSFTIFAVIAAVLMVLLFRVMSNSPGSEVSHWSARFESVSGLRQGDDVRLAGVKIGRVDAIEVVDGEARVRFTARADVPLHEGTRLTLRYQNLLGQRYLALTAPADEADRGARLDAGAELPISNTDPGFDLTALLNGFKPLFDVLEPAEVNALAENLVAVLQGESGTVESLLRHTAEATSFLADRDEVFTRVLENLTPVLRNLESRSDDVDATLVAFRELMTGLAEDRDSIGGSVDSLAQLVDSTSELLGELRPGLKRDVTALRDTSELLVTEAARVSAAVRHLPPLLEAFARTMSYGAFLNVYLCNLGVEAGGQRIWVPGPDGPYSEVCRGESR